MANVDLIATWKTGCIPTLTNFTKTWFNPSKTENIIRKDAAKPLTDLLVIDL